MTKFAFALLMTSFVSTNAMSQGAPTVPSSVGAIQSTDGLVTVSQANTLGNAFKDERLLDGARVATTGTGTASIKLDNGCVIRLERNQSVTIDSRRDCRALVASIQSTVPATAGASGFVGENPVGLIALGAGAIGAYFNMRQHGSGS